MLGVGLLAQALRHAGQLGHGRWALAAASAAWHILQPGEHTTLASGVGGSRISVNCLQLTGSSSLRCASCSTIALDSNTAQPGSGSIGGAGPAGERALRKGSEKEAQPQVQAWLQQEQGLAVKAADQHARRLARVFGSQQAALEGLPATFAWCRGRGLTGLQTAQLLDRIATKRHENVVQFAALVQPVWQLMDSYVAAWEEQQRRVGESRLRKHSSLAEVLCSTSNAALALCMPPDHVEAWLAAVSERMPAAAVGRLLLRKPSIVCGSPFTALAAISWAADVLGATGPAAFFSWAPTLLAIEEVTLQRNLDNLQQAVGAGQARHLVLKRSALLTSSPDTVQAALAWLRQLFPDAEQLTGILGRGALLLKAPVRHLQGNADCLQRALGWQDGDGQLAAFIAARPSDFATINLNSEDTQHKLLLLSEVVGVSVEECLSAGIGYLNKGLDSIAARYVLVQARAPELLYSRSGERCLTWIISANQPHNLRRLRMTRVEFNAFVRGWPSSEEGRCLLEGLSSGSVEGWQQPPSWEEARQRRQQIETNGKKPRRSSSGRRQPSIGRTGNEPS